MDTEVVKALRKLAKLRNKENGKGLMKNQHEIAINSGFKSWAELVRNSIINKKP